MEVITDEKNISRRTISEDIGKGLKIWHEVSKVILKDNGKNIGMLCTRHDITEKKSIEQEMLSKEEILSKAQNIAHIGSWDWDITNNDLYWSNETFRIYEKNPVIFIPTMEKVTTMFPDDDRKRVRNELHKIISGNGNEINIEHQILRDSGETRTVHEVGEVYRDKDNKATRMIGVTHDITDSKHAEKTKNDFLAVVSHELRTPLHGILSFAKLGLRKADTQPIEKIKSYFSEISESGDNLLRLVSDILDIGKMESGKMTFNNNNVNIMNLIDKAYSHNIALAQKNNININITERCQDPIAYVDEGRILQALNNLISNAIKFSDDNTTIDISVITQDNNTVKLSITDHGRGIPHEFQRKIFIKFSQYDSSATRNIAGTGLGLAITKAIIEEQSGTIGFDSTPGEGTTFYFTLPLAKD